MAFQAVSGDYTPAGGEKIRLSYSYVFAVVPLSEADIRQLIEAAGYQVIDVSVSWINVYTFTVDLLAPGGTPIKDIAAAVGAAVADSWRAWSVTPLAYQAETHGLGSLLPTPTTTQTVSLVAIAILALAVVYVIASAKKIW